MSILKKAFILGAVALCMCAFSSNNIPDSKIGMFSSVEQVTISSLSLILNNNIPRIQRDK